MAERKARHMPYIAVSLNGNLEVTAFRTTRKAKRLYAAIRDRYKDCGSFEENGTCFSLDESEGPMVAFGIARIVDDDMRWRIK